jgi:hypothetical protein
MPVAGVRDHRAPADRECHDHVDDRILCRISCDVSAAVLARLLLSELMLKQWFEPVVPFTVMIGLWLVLMVENVTMGMAVKNMSFSIYASEVVGIAGLIGSGRTEIAKVVHDALKQWGHHPPARKADPLSRAAAGHQ